LEEENQNVWKRKMELEIVIKFFEERSKIDAESSQGRK
jgi:hypothetical protein